LRIEASDGRSCGNPIAGTSSDATNTTVELRRNVYGLRRHQHTEKIGADPERHRSW